MNVAQALEKPQVDDIDFLELDRIIEEDFGNDKENLIMILQAIQKQFNYLPRPALTYLATKIGMPLSKIYGVATFYSTFSLEPRGRNIISICLGTACHVRGAERGTKEYTTPCPSVTVKQHPTCGLLWSRFAVSAVAAWDRSSRSMRTCTPGSHRIKS